jgi:hypothetical protein
MEASSKSLFYARGFALWIIFTIAAIVVGWFRDFAIVPWFGNWIALFSSGVLMAGIYYIGALLMLTVWEPPKGKKHLLFLGLMWSGISFGTEVVSALYLRGYTLGEYLILYHPRDLFLKGETITFGLTFVIFAPLLANKMLKKKS